jgi:hypothetical protein
MKRTHPQWVRLVKHKHNFKILVINLLSLSFLLFRVYSNPLRHGEIICSLVEHQIKSYCGQQDKVVALGDSTPSNRLGVHHRSSNLWINKRFTSERPRCGCGVIIERPRCGLAKERDVRRWPKENVCY